MFFYHLKTYKKEYKMGPEKEVSLKPELESEPELEPELEPEPEPEPEFEILVVEPEAAS